MNRYKVTYKDCGQEVLTMKLKAYDFEHAEEKFFYAIEDWQGDHRGIELVKIVKIN